MGKAEKTTRSPYGPGDADPYAADDTADPHGNGPEPEPEVLVEEEPAPARRKGTRKK